jgi:hypothetical protein
MRSLLIMRVVMNDVLTTVFGPKEGKVPGEWYKIYHGIS